MSRPSVGSAQWSNEAAEKDVIEKDGFDHFSSSTAYCALHSLSLSHFRNYGSLRLEPEGRSVALIGPNGAGKTNILEAISLLSPGRGLRRARLAELDAQHAPPGHAWTVAAQVRGLQGDAQLGTARFGESETDRRLVRIDGADAKSQHALSEHFAIVWLTPQMDQMWTEGDAAKRRFLDRLTYAFDGEHAARVAAYEYHMRERNRLLQGPADPHWLATLEGKMAERATAIALARLQTVDALRHLMQESALSFPKAELALSGFVEARLQEGETALAAEQAYMEKLAQDRPVDAAAGRTGEGAHRSILTIRYINKNMDAEFCSTGEQKALLLSLVLAHARACARWKSRMPVLLLDEVAAHLDENRRHELFDELHDLRAQVWMTGTDETLFEGLHGALRLRVEQGSVHGAEKEKETV